MEKRDGTVKLNMVPNFLNKCAFSKDMINIFNILTTKMKFNKDIYLSNKENIIRWEGIPNNQPKEKFNLRKEI